MRQIKKITRLSMVMVVWATALKSAAAYIDPGTVGMTVSNGIWPFIVGIFAVAGGFFVKFFFQPIKRVVLAIWNKVKGR